MKLEHFLASYAKVNSKQIEELNVRPDTIKLWGRYRQETIWKNSNKFHFDPPLRVMGKKNKNKNKQMSPN